MRMLAVCSVLALTAGTPAQELRVLPAGDDAQKMLYRYLLQQAQQHFDARRKVVAQLQTPGEIRRRQADLKARFRAALGDFPARMALHPRVVGQLKGQGFRVEKIIYESRPDHHVTAVLYLPDSTSPVPGVLVPCGHINNGKAAEAYQRACILLAQNGLAVLCYDPIGQGERVQLLNAQGKSAIGGSTAEHTMTGIGALLVGGSTAAYRIWDGIRSLDYLAGRPEIDPQRLGCTGNSGGGTLTAYLMALDDRIVAAAPSCYLTSLERLFATIGPQDAEQNITGQVAFGMEHADYVTMRAPQATLMCVATMDAFDIDGAWTSFREAKLLYGKLGFGERVSLFEFNDGHGFSKPRREAAMRWMRRWLLQKDDARFEDNFTIFSDAQLQCTRTGQVLEDFKGKSVFHLNAQQSKELVPARAKQLAELRRDNLLQTVVKHSPRAKGKVQQRSTVQRSGYQIVKRIYETEPGIQVPGLEYIPADAREAPRIVYLHGRGMSVEAGAGGALEKLANSGRRVLALDLRGFGETAPVGGSKVQVGHFGADWKEAFLGLHLDRPLLGQRVFDLLQVLEMEKAQEVHLLGVETAGPIALHAALDGRVGRLTLEGSLASWASLAENPLSRNQLANVIPNVLKVYDLPELASLLAPLPLTIRQPVDGLGRPVSQPELNRLYRPCRAAYGKREAGENLVLQAAP